MPVRFSCCHWLVVILALILSPPLIAGINNWTNHGPEGGSVDHLAFDPMDKSISYAVLSGIGYRTTDGGQSWEELASPQLLPQILKIVPDPRHSGTIYALVVSRGLVRSTDFGDHWTILGPRDQTFGNLVIAPGNPTFFFATGYHFVVSSTNDGFTWSPPLSSSEIANNPATLSLRGIIVHPEKPEVMLKLDAALQKSTDGGKTWASLKLLTAAPVTGLVMEQQAPYTLYASMRWSDGIVLSTDEGETWSSWNAGITNLNVSAIAMASSDNRRLLAGTAGAGIFKSENGGETWVACNKGIRRPLIQDTELGASAGTVYVTSSGGGVFKSTDYGRTWLSRNVGFPHLLAHDLAIDAFDPSILYATVGSHLFRSTNAGESWQASGTGVESDYIDFVQSDRRISGRIFGFGGFLFTSTDHGKTWTKGTHLPGLKESVLVSPHEDRIYITTALGLYVTDGSFESVRQLSSLMLTDLAADPASAQRLYGIASIGGVYKSTDRGETWTMIGLKNESLSRLAVDPKNSRFLVVAGNSGLYMTSDSGQTWKRLAGAPESEGLYNASGPSALAVDFGRGPAIFAGSSYQGGLFDLTKSSSLFLPRLVSAVDTASTGLALANHSEETLHLVLTALGANGQPLAGAGIQNPVNIDLPSGKQTVFEAGSLFGIAGTGEMVGWIQVDGTQDQVTGFFSAYSPDLGIFDTGPLTGKTASNLLFSEAEPSRGTSEIWLANPGQDTAQVVLQLIGPEGSPEATDVKIEIPPRGVFSQTTAQLFGESPGGAGAYIRAKSGQPLVGLEFLTRSKRYGAFLGGRDPADSSRLLYSPQFAASSDADTRITLVNTDAAPGLVQVIVRANDGKPVGVEEEVPIAPLGKLTIKASELLGSTGGSGYLEIRSPWVALIGDARFSDPAQERYSAALPLFLKGAKKLQVSHLVSTYEFFTGLAILNLGSETAGVLVKVRAADGTELAHDHLLLQPGERISKLLTEYFPQLAGQTLTSGMIYLESEQDLAVYALFGSQSLSSLSAIPAEVLQ